VASGASAFAFVRCDVLCDYARWQSSVNFGTGFVTGFGGFATMPLTVPVAMLASLMVFAVSVASGFLADAIDIYTGIDDSLVKLGSALR
jgi:hypothetical protein